MLSTAGLQIRQNAGNMSYRNWRSIHCRIANPAEHKGSLAEHKREPAEHKLLDTHAEQLI